MRRALFVLPLALVLAGCGGDPDESARAPVQQGDTTATLTTEGGTRRERLPRPVVDNFLENCVGDAGAERKALCGCIVTRLQGTATRRELVSLSGGRGTPSLKAQRKLERATEGCEAER